jgi:hypothetical protein
MIFMAFKSATPAVIFIIYAIIVSFVSSSTGSKKSNSKIDSIINGIKSVGEFIILALVVAGVAAFKLVEKG